MSHDSHEHEPKHHSHEPEPCSDPTPADPPIAEPDGGPAIPPDPPPE